MSQRRFGLLALVCAGASAVASAAAAQAPIVYAGQERPTATQTASIGDALTGGGDTSYGYGAPARSNGATIDIRRNARGAATEQAQPRPSAPTERYDVAERTQPEWLERERVGPPYEANGQWYVPTPEPGYSETGTASWYGPTFHGQATASGEVFDQEALTAAHPTLPIPSLVQVTNLENGREVIVRVNDRGPFVDQRLIDLSRRSAEVLGFEQAGQARVHVRYLGPAPRRVDGATAANANAPAPQAAEPGQGPTSLLPAPVETAANDDLQGAPIGPARSLPVSAPAYAPATGGYFVQVGAFSDLSNAHRVRDTVGAAGPVVVDVRRTAAGGELFRVRVGPWQSRDEADAARRQLVSLGYAETVVAAR